MNKSVKKSIIYLIDFVSIPLTIISSIWLKFIRTRIVGLWSSESPFSKFIFDLIGVFPIINHYYEPQFVYNKESFEISSLNRSLPGIDLDLETFKRNMTDLNYSEEIIEISKLPLNNLNYNFKAGSFLSGDSEILYSLIRKLKPKKII